MKNELTLLSGSGKDNSLNQWTYDENSEFKFLNTRKRYGIKKPIQKMRFYDENGIYYKNKRQSFDS